MADDKMKETAEQQSKGISTTQLIAMMGGIKDNVPNTSIMDELDGHKKALIDSVKDSKALNDAYGNSLTSTGTDDKVKSFSSYGFSNDTLNWPLWICLYQDSWVFKRAIDKPATDMVRPGITIQLKDSEKLKTIQRQLKKARNSLIELIQWGRLFGGSIAVMMFEGMEDNDYDNKLNVEKVKKSKTLRLYITDRWYGLQPSDETVDDMNSLDFGKPASYRVTMADGSTIKVHHDYILRFEGRTAPKLIKCGQLQGWGYAEGAHILNELSRDDQLKSAITSLVNKSLIEVIKMSGMRGVFLGADSDNEQQLRKRLEMVNWGRTFNSLTFLDKDDEYQEHGFGGLGGLSDLMENNMWLIAAALEMQGVLYGDLKNGMGADGAALERYDETILNLDEAQYRPVLEKLLSVLYIKEDIDEKVEFEFNSLLVKKQDKERLEGMKDYQQLLSGLLGDGVITAKQYAKAFADYTNKGIASLHFTEEDLNKLDDNIEEEIEGIDIDNLQKQRKGVK